MIERWNPLEHEPLLISWINERNMGTNLGEPLLPPTGFVVDRTAAGFLYNTDSRLAYVGSIVADPKATKADRARAISTLLDCLCDEARKNGYTAIAGSPSVTSLTDRFREAGFITVDGCSYAIRRVS